MKSKFSNLSVWVIFLSMFLGGYSLNAQQTFTKLTNHTDVRPDGTYMIVDVNGGFALTSENGAASAPTAVPVVIENNVINGVIDSVLQWKIYAEDGGYKISTLKDETKFLYSTSSNNGIRVGGGDANVWTFDITDDTKPDYHGFKNNEQGRYLGVYKESDWRSYTTINSTIEATQIEIFELDGIPNPPVNIVSTPTFSIPEGTYTTQQDVEIICATEGATIYYTMNGDEPSVTSDVYNNPITISTTTTIKAMAVKEGLDNSEVAVATYTFTEVSIVDITYIVNGVSEVVSVPAGQITLKTDVTELWGFEFKGWTSTEIIGSAEPTSVVILSGEMTVNEDITLYAVFGGPEKIYYSKHTTTDGLEGDFLIVYEADSLVFDGSLDTLDVSDNYITVAITDNMIENADALENSCFTISSTEAGYAVKSKSGYYIGKTSNSNGLNSSTTEVYDNTISFDTNGDADIVSSETRLRFNSASNQMRFRYYVNGQKAVQLYKKIVLDSDVCTTIEVIEDMTVSGNVVKDNVSINGVVTVSSGAILTINGVIGNISPDKFIIEDGGQLIHNNAGVMATVKQDIENPLVWGEDKTGWQIISSPMMYADVTNFTTGDADYDLYKWVPENKNNGQYVPWYNQKSHVDDFTTLDKGMGYLVSYKSTTSFDNTGELNYGTTFDFDLSTYDDANELSSYTLLGNPFAYDIEWSDMSKTNIYKDGYAVVEDGAFRYYSEGTIPVAEGFMVMSTAAEPALKYTKDSGAAKRDSDDANKINIIVEGNGGTDNAVIVINDGDGGFEKLENINDEISLVFVASGNERYGIYSCSEEIDTISIGFDAKSMSEFKLRIEPEGDFKFIYLIDNSTGDKINMLMEEYYEFVGMPDGNINRFIIVVADNYDIEEIEIRENFAYITNGNLIIEKMKGAGELKIIDITGRLMMTEKVSLGARINVESLSTGIYIIRMMDESGVKTQKMLVK